MEEEEEEEGGVSIFSKKHGQRQSLSAASPSLLPRNTQIASRLELPEDTTVTLDFSHLGLSEWLLNTCLELGMKRPTLVQRNCIPQILKGKNVLGLAQTGSGKTAAFALPILHRLAESSFGVFALVLTPTRELAFQLADQFKALGSALHLRCSVIVGDMNVIEQARCLMQRPHVVVATPGRLANHLKNDSQIPSIFTRLQVLVLDEADRLLDVSFESELRTILANLPSQRQTLLFSATMTAELKALHELSGEKAYLFEAYEGLKTVEELQQQYIFMPAAVKDVYLAHLMSTIEERGIRSAIIFTSTCRACHALVLLLEELGTHAVALHSLKRQQQRLATLNRFKSGQVPILIATDVASRGLDIPTVDLVVNYDIPRFARDYVHRVGRTARAGRGGFAVSLVSQYDIELVHEIERLIGKMLEKFEINEEDVLKNITKVYKAKRFVRQKMDDGGFEELINKRKSIKQKLLAEKGLVNTKKKRKTTNVIEGGC